MGVMETLTSLEVEIDTLHPYPGNPRQGDIELLKGSLERHGQYRPIVVNQPTMQVLAGNQTLTAAKELGWKRIAATYVDVDEDQAKRIVLVDNRANDKAGYDELALADLLATFHGDLDGTGFEKPDLDRLLNSLQVGAEHGGDGASQLSGIEYRLMIRCESEQHQAELLERLQDEGLDVQALAL